MCIRLQASLTIKEELLINYIFHNLNQIQKSIEVQFIPLSGLFFFFNENRMKIKSIIQNFSQTSKKNLKNLKVHEHIIT